MHTVMSGIMHRLNEALLKLSFVNYFFQRIINKTYLQQILILNYSYAFVVL